MTTALTVVEPTSIPIRNWLDMLVGLGLHAIGNVMNKVGSAAYDTLGVRHLIERLPGFGVCIHPGAALIEGEAGGFERGGEFLLRLVLGFAEGHLDAGMGVDLTFARRFDRDEDHVLVVTHHGGLRTIALRTRHAAEGLE